MVVQILLCILMSYAIGCINPSYIIGLVRGFDIRKRGSGNAGASNAVIVLGAKAGVFSMIFDIAKAFFTVQIAPLIFDELSVAMEIAAVGVIAGHVFPFYMKFKGGKGLACLGGSLLGMDWRIFLIMLGIEVVILFSTNYLCFVPLTASVAFPIVHYIKYVAILGMEEKWIGSCILILATVIMVYKHCQNIFRICTGQEMRFSYVWSSAEKKEMEKQRVAQNGEKYRLKKLEKQQAKNQS